MATATSTQRCEHRQHRQRQGDLPERLQGRCRLRSRWPDWPSDTVLVGSGTTQERAAGWITSLSVGNDIGFSGYVFNSEVDGGGLYTVRNRHFDPVWGRWISRDPSGYANSNSLYGYGWATRCGARTRLDLDSGATYWMDSLTLSRELQACSFDIGELILDHPLESAGSIGRICGAS